MFRLKFTLVAGSFFATAALAQDALFVPTVHILNTKGEFQTFVLAGQENGVSRTECEMRLEAWEQEMNFAATIETLREQGENASLKTSCVPK